MNNYKMVLFIAERAKNTMLQKVRQWPESRQLVKPKIVVFTMPEPPTREYFMKIIEANNNQDWWVPAISFEESIFADPTVMALSNGSDRDIYVRGN
jgi:hypothetical protein